MKRIATLATGPAPLPAWLAPKGLKGTELEAVVVAGGLGGLAIAFAAEVATPRDITFTPFALLIVLVAAWLIGPRWLLILVLGAALAQALRPLFGNASWVTVGLNWIALGLSGALAHVAAANTAEARRSRERELAVLLETARQMNQAGDVAEVLERVTRAAAGSAGCARAAVWQIEGDVARAVAERDARGAVLLDRPIRITSDLRLAFPSRQARELTPDQLSPDLATLLRSQGVRSVAVAPIMVDGHLFGVLAASATGPARFTPPQLAILTGLSELAGIAIARAREVETQRSRTRVLELLREVLLATASAAAPEDVAQRVVEEARRMVGAREVVLALRDRERPGLWVKASTHHVELAALGPDTMLGRAFTRAEALTVSTGERRDSPVDVEIGGGAATLLVAPVLAGQDCLGVIAAGVDAAADDAMHLLALLGSQLGSAVLASELRGELVESERVFRSLCAGLGCAAVLHDGAGRTVEANWAAESVTGVSIRELLAGDVFGSSWSMKAENGCDIPLSMRPPRYVMSFDRPLLGLVAEVTAPAGRPAWVRIDSNPILERGRLKWIVTTFYPVPPPASRAAKPRRRAAL